MPLASIWSWFGGIPTVAERWLPLMFFLCMVGQLVWVLKVMPETKNVPLEEMERNLGIELSEEDVSGAQSGPRAH